MLCVSASLSPQPVPVGTGPSEPSIRVMPDVLKSKRIRSDAEEECNIGTLSSSAALSSTTLSAVVCGSVTIGVLE